MQNTGMTALPSLSFWSVLLAVAVAAVWGFNFVMVKVGLDEIPPLTFCSLRFFFASVPAIFLIKKPDTSWRYIIGYGLLTFALQFSLLFLGMAVGVTPGIAALIVQLQVFFAIFFAYLFAKQSMSAWQILGALISFSGIVVIGFHRGGSLSGLGFMLIVMGAVSWGLGNVLSTKFKDINMLALVVWSSFVAFFPLFGVSCLVEHPMLVLKHPETLTWSALIALAYVTYISTHFGYGCWSWLLSRHSMATIAPFALLCPIVALLCSAFMLNESFESWKMVATVLVIIGLSINVFGKRLTDFFTRSKRA